VQKWQDMLNRHPGWTWAEQGLRRAKKEAERLRDEVQAMEAMEGAT
jgi:hypothetical protein